MKKIIISLSIVIMSIFNYSCNSSAEEETVDFTLGTNTLIGDWKVSK